METSEISANAIAKFMSFCYNFPYNFVREIEWTCNTQHMESKFNHYYDVYGSHGVVLMFWGDLDYENRRRLVDYVMNVYQSSAKLY